MNRECMCSHFRCEGQSECRVEGWAYALQCWIDNCLLHNQESVDHHVTECVRQIKYWYGLNEEYP